VLTLEALVDERGVEGVDHVAASKGVSETVAAPGAQDGARCIQPDGTALEMSLVEQGTQR
jgi:hypothetical protein